MTKPLIRKFSQLAELMIQKYERYLPTAFDESLTLLEKVNKIIEYLNQVGLLINETMEQWNEIFEWVMNDGLTDAVANKLNKMVLDGTFDTIINHNVLGSRSRIVVSVDEPSLPDDTTFWYEDVGDAPDFGGCLGDGVIVANATVHDDEPDDDNKLWFDEI